MLKKILIVDKVHPLLVQKLTEKGYHCEVDRTITYHKFIELPDTYYGLVIRSRFAVDKELLLSKPHLKFVARIGSGVEHIDVPFAQSRGISCISTPEGNADSVAEHCLALLLSALRKIPTANQEVREGLWLREKNKGSLLTSHKYGIIGYGNNGSAFAQLLARLGCSVWVYDRYAQPTYAPNVVLSSLEEVLQVCDIISLHVNYIPENHYFVNSDFLQKWKNPNILINSSRGQVLNCSDLLYALQENKVGCACLDVLEYENVKLQIPDKNEWDNTLQVLMENPQIVFTPHIAGQTLEAEQKHAEVAFNKIINLENK